MELVECIREWLRPELSVDEDIVKREKDFNEYDESREEWVLNHVYLCKGDLKQLENHPDYHPFDAQVIRAWFPNNLRHKIVRVCSVDGEKLERELKLELYYKGCNAGVFYKTYSREGSLVAEAVPAKLECE